MPEEHEVDPKEAEEAQQRLQAETEAHERLQWTESGSPRPHWQGLHDYLRRSARYRWWSPDHVRTDPAVPVSGREG